jgi:fatty acid desaturase
MQSSSNQQWPFSKPLEFLQRVKYGGAVGKQIAVVIVALLVLAVVAVCAWGQTIVVYIIAPLVVVVLVIGLFAVQRTLDKHPEQALYEGAEYLEYQRIKYAATKDVPQLPDTPLTIGSGEDPRNIAAPEGGR